MEAGGEEDWGEMLDRLSKCISRQEEAAVKQASLDTGSPSQLTDLHNHVAALLVEHGITTWAHLQASFPAHGTPATARKETLHSLDEGKKQMKAGKPARKQAQAPEDLVEADQHPMKRQRRRLGWKNHPHLAERRPDLVAEWDEAKNGCSADEACCGSKWEPWWCCQDCGKCWECRISNRVTQRPGCLECRKKK